MITPWIHIPRDRLSRLCRMKARVNSVNIFLFTRYAFFNSDTLRWSMIMVFILDGSLDHDAHVMGEKWVSLQYSLYLKFARVGCWLAKKPKLPNSTGHSTLAMSTMVGFWGPFLTLLSKLYLNHYVIFKSGSAKLYQTRKKREN